MTHDSKLAVAEKRLADAKAEVARWELFIRTYRELEIDPSVSDSRELVMRVNVPNPPINGHKTEKPEKPSKLTVTERVAATIIKDFGRPVPSPEMLRELIDRGVDIGGKEPASTLAARLSRAESIEFRRGMGWGLKKSSETDSG